MEITIISQDASWQPKMLPIERSLNLCLQHLSESEARAVAVVLTNDAQVQLMNAQYRGKDKPTNVLSFPSDEPDEWGDLIFAHETIAREADEQEKAFESHFSHLLIHGMLHLLGYDHLEEQEAEEMESLEIEILAKLGVANPYENA